MPNVVPPKGIPEYHSDQSQHEHIPSLPLRAIIAGPSGCGKTMLIVTMITDLYRKKDGKSVFKRVYVFSPSFLAARSQYRNEYGSDVARRMSEMTMSLE